MNKLNKKEKKWITDNWKEIIGILYNNIDEKALFEVLLEDYEQGKGFFEVLEKIILINENWFTSNITFETKVALLKEMTGNRICNYCGSPELLFQEIKEEQKVIVVCKSCNSKISDVKIKSPEF